MDLDKVKATNFYKDDGDKIKLNWFLYEYANALYLEIAKNPKLTRYRKLNSEKRIEAFCVYFSKRLRKSIHDAQTGQAENVVFNGQYVYEFHPKNSYEQTQTLIDTALAAWKKQLQLCAICSHKCLNEGYEITGMFDSLEKTGWPT
jgi:uncharacterized Fe-S radical SAM superfamily protein PflX